MAKAFTREIELLVEYIKDEKTKGNDWTIIKYRDVPELTGLSSYYVKKVFELLKEHPHIVFEIDKDSKTFKKPLKFKYVENQKEKIEKVITEKSFYYLDQNEIDNVQKTMELDNYEELYRYLNLINYLSHTGAKEKFVKFSLKEASDLLVYTRKEIDEMIEALKKKNILVDRDGMVSIIFDVARIKDQETNPIEPTNNAKKSITNDGILALLSETSPKEGPEASIDEDLFPEASLVENMKNFRNSISEMQEGFSLFLNSELKKLTNDEETKQQVDEGYETLQKLVKENGDLTSQLEDLQEEKQLLEKSLKSAQNFKDKFLQNSEQRLEILLAETINTISRYANIPAWEKNQGTNARLQKDILSSVTSAVEDIINFKEEY